jgi:hypothetical protein
MNHVAFTFENVMPTIQSIELEKKEVLSSLFQHLLTLHVMNSNVKMLVDHLNKNEVSGSISFFTNNHVIAISYDFSQKKSTLMIQIIFQSKKLIVLKTLLKLFS